MQALRRLCSTWGLEGSKFRRGQPGWELWDGYISHYPPISRRKGARVYVHVHTIIFTYVCNARGRNTPRIDETANARQWGADRPEGWKAHARLHLFACSLVNLKITTLYIRDLARIYTNSSGRRNDKRVWTKASTEKPRFSTRGVFCDCDASSGVITRLNSLCEIFLWDESRYTRLCKFQLL